MPHVLEARLDVAKSGREQRRPGVRSEVADVRAQQMCWQLILNEGTLEFGRLYGADASHDSKLNSFFRVRDVPEVFAHFDEFSYELSKLDLKNFRQSAMAGDMLRESGLG